MLKTIITSAATVSAIRLRAADCQDCYEGEMMHQTEKYYENFTPIDAAVELVPETVTETIMSSDTIDLEGTSISFISHGSKLF